MSTFDDTFSAAAVPALHEQFGEPVMLRRGSTTKSVTADWEQAKAPVHEVQEFATAAVERTWYVDVSEYAFSGQASEPREGDRLVDAAGATWEIFSNGDRDAVRQLGSQWEFDTKRVAT